MWESAVFETPRVLSVLLITVSTRMPVVQSKLSPPCCWISGSALTHSCNARVFSNWILAFIAPRVEPPPAIAPPPQWAAPFCMVYVNPRSPSATFTAVCVTRSTWKGSSHLSTSSSFSCDHESPRNRQVSPRAGISQQPSPGSFYLHRNIWQQTRHFFAVIQHVIFTHILWWQPCYPPSMPMNGGLPNKISNGLRFGFLLFFSFSCTSVQLEEL